MWMLLKMAWRNLWRHRRRSILTLLTMTFGLYASHVTLGVSDGAHRQMVEVATAGFIGHIQINANQYQDTKRQYLVLRDEGKAGSLLKALSSKEGKLPNSLKKWRGSLKGWTRRINGAGLVSTGDHSGGGLLLGLELQGEQKVTRLPSILFRAIAVQAALAKPKSHAAAKAALFSKAYLSSIRALWKKQPKPSAQRSTALHKLSKPELSKVADEPGFWKKLLTSREIVLGKGLATTLQAKVGMSLAVVTQAVNGSLGNNRYTIAAIVESGNEDLDHALGILTLEAMQELLVLPKQSHQFVLSLKRAEHDRILSLTEDINKELQGVTRINPVTKKPERAIEVLSWNKVSPELYEFIKMDEAGGYVTLILLFILVVFGVLNTLLMSVMERIREFGLLQSLGMKNRRLTLLVVCEGLCLAGLSTVIGLAASIPTILYFSSANIPLGDPMRVGGITFQMTLTADLTWTGILFSVGLVFLTTFLVSLIPAMKVRSLRPAEALRYQ